MDAAGLTRAEIHARPCEDEARLLSNIRMEIRAMEEGKAQRHRELLAYNLYRGVFACDC